MRVDLRSLACTAWLCLDLAGPVGAENPCGGPAPFETLALGGDESGLGGTGHGDPDSGIGGTGRGGDESGIGGTGRGDGASGIGGTGIYGGGEVSAEIDLSETAAPAFTEGCRRTLAQHENYMKVQCTLCRSGNRRARQWCLPDNDKK